MSRTNRTTRMTRTSYRMARQEGIEPPTHSLEGCCSIQLSYWRFVHSGATPLPHHECT